MSVLTESGLSRQAVSDGPVAESTFKSNGTENLFDMYPMCERTADVAINTFYDLKADNIFESLTQDFEGHELFDWMTWLNETQ